MVLRTVGPGGWTVWAVAKGTKKTKLSSRGAIRLKSTQIIWFSWWQGGRLNHINCGQRRLRYSWKNSWKPRDLFERQVWWQPKKESTSSFQGMKKKGDVTVNTDDDDEVWTNASQNCATAAMSTEEFFLRTQYI
jgi:hypothetical protein